MEKQIVVTGIGIISALGDDKTQFWGNLTKGVSGIKPVTLFDVSSFKNKLAGEITEFDPKAYLGKKGIRHIDRTSLLISSAAKLALQDANVNDDTYGCEEKGIVFGSTYGSIDSISEFDMEALKEGPNYVNPMAFPNTVLNAPASRASIFCNATGLNSTISNGVTSSIDSIIYASDFLKMSRVKAVLTGGVFGLTYGIYLGTSHAKLLSGSDGNPNEISAPFDKRRNGFVLGEGAAVMLLENIDDAKKRNATIYGEIKGYGTSFSPNKVIGKESNVDDGKRAITIALNEASLTADNISFISANANSSIDGDIRESRIIKEVFGDQTKNTPVTAVKSMIGECLDASGAMQTISSLLAINNGAVPPTINCEELDEKCGLECVPDECREMAVENVLINSFSDIGNASSLIVSKF